MVRCSRFNAGFSRCTLGYLADTDDRLIKLGKLLKILTKISEAYIIRGGMDAPPWGYPCRVQGRTGARQCSPVVTRASPHATGATPHNTGSMPHNTGSMPTPTLWGLHFMPICRGSLEHFMGQISIADNHCTATVSSQHYGGDKQPLSVEMPQTPL